MNADRVARSDAMRLARRYPALFSGGERVLPALQKTLAFRRSALTLTEGFCETEAISQFRSALVQNRYLDAVDAIKRSVSGPVIDGPDLALLKLNKSVLVMAQSALPRGLSSAVRDLHVSTAKDLAVSPSIRYSTKRSLFFSEADPKSMCSAKTANVIFSADRLFSTLDEEDLLSFLRYLSSFPSLASTHKVGEKILEAAHSMAHVDFDAEFYYHGRALEDEACPYTDEEMARAPHGAAAQGRYNHEGQSYFYFSDRLHGAVSEIRIHHQKKRVQVAKLRPLGSVRLADLSEHTTNAFLKFCRFPFAPNPASKAHREYLIPSFFSDCCKLAGFDGIKYRGAGDYSNYVTWSDGHFAFVSQTIEPPTAQGEREK